MSEGLSFISYYASVITSNSTKRRKVSSKIVKKKIEIDVSLVHEFIQPIAIKLDGRAYQGPLSRWSSPSIDAQ